MQQKTKRNIAIGTIASTLGTILAAVAMKGVKFVLGLAKSLVALAWQSLASKYSVPVWLLLIGVLWILFTLYAVVRRILIEARQPQPDTHYFQDTFLGLTWRWTYSNQTINPPFCFCPSCDTLLIWDITISEQYIAHFEGKSAVTSIKCEHCHRELYHGDGDQRTIQAQVVRQIDRKIRTGEWQKPLSNNSK